MSAQDPASQLTANAAGAIGRSASPLALRWRRFLEHRVAVASGLVLLLLIIAAFSAPLVEIWMGIDANRPNLLNRFAAPSARHPLGTDDLGRDFLLRLLYGGQVSLIVGLAAAAASAVIGTIIGILAGYYGGWLDALLMRLTDGVIALPLLPFLIILAAVDLARLPFVPDAWTTGQDASLYRIVAIVTLFGWTTVARLVRGATLSVRQRDYVRAAAALGASSGRVILVHILPNVASPIVVATTLSIGQIILLESVLSFLGLGIQPPTPSWGNILTNAQELIWTAPHLAIYPGLLIFITVIAFNFLGDGLQDAMDPRSVVKR